LAVAAAKQRRSTCLVPDHAFADLALSRRSAPDVPSPDPMRFWSAPARRKRDFELRHAVRQAAKGLLLP